MIRLPTIWDDDDRVEFFSNGNEILCSVYRKTILTAYRGLPLDARQEIEDYLAKMNFTKRSNQHNFESWSRPAPAEREVPHDVFDAPAAAEDGE